MSDFVTVDRSADHDVRKGPNVVDVGAWLANAKTLRRDFAIYVPRHRAAGIAV
jgi:hypothetical protein